MEIPAKIREFLDRRLATSARPCCMLVDADNLVVDCWGDRAAYGLDAVAGGQDVLRIAPFLAGQPVDQYFELPFLTDSNGRGFHIYSIPEGESRYVLYVDAEQDRQRRQETQQIANESRLVVARQKRLIAELIDSRTELAIRRKEAEQQSRMRGRYMAMMSHEFRTPLTAAMGYIDLIQDGLGMSDVTREHVDRLRRVTQQQLVLVDNLLNQARMEAGGIPIRQTTADIRRTIEDIAILIAPLAAEKELAFSAALGPTLPDYLQLDEIRFRQIVVNVLGNAVKYSEEGGVQLTVDWRDGRLSVRIEDTGPGISGDQLRDLFKPFERGDTEPRQSGAGLGLSVSKQLAEAMGGTLTLRSRLGEGTSVVLDLPAMSAVDVCQDDDQIQWRGTPGRVLIAEDDPDLRHLLSLWLDQDDHEVIVAADGEEALTRTLDEQPDLLIVDINMPRLDGPGAARALRARGYDGPILALSGAHDPCDVEFALSSGCDEFVPKPPHRGSFLRIVRRLLLDQGP